MYNLHKVYKYYNKYQANYYIDKEEDEINPYEV